MDEAQLIFYLDRLFKRDLSKNDILLLVYDLLREQYNRTNMDTLRKDAPSPQNQEYEVPIAQVTTNPALPALVISSYLTESLKRNHA